MFHKESRNHSPYCSGYYHDNSTRYRRRKDRQTSCQDRRSNHRDQLMFEDQDLSCRRQKQRSHYVTEVPVLRRRPPSS